LSTPAAKYAATSSTQIGWIRVPARADDRRHRRDTRKSPEGREDPAVAGEHEARPENDVLDPRAADGLLHFPLGSVIGHQVLRFLAGAERAHEHEAPDACLLRRVDEVAGSPIHHPAKVLIGSLADRHEVDDHLSAFYSAAQAGRVTHIARHQLGAPGGEGGGGAVARPANEAAHRQLPFAQRVHDPRADEAGAAGDQDHALDSTAPLL